MTGRSSKGAEKITIKLTATTTAGPDCMTLAGNPKYVIGQSGVRGKHTEADDVPRPMSIKERVEQDRRMEAAEGALCRQVV